MVQDDDASLPQKDRVVDLSDLVHRIANEIDERDAEGLPPQPDPSEQLPLDVSLLEPDSEESAE